MNSSVMQKPYLPKSREELRQILCELANVSGEKIKNEEQAQRFLAGYGPLFPVAGHQILEARDSHPGLSMAHNPVPDILHYAPRFRLAWAAKNGNPEDVKAVNSFLDDIFRPDYFSHDPLDQRPAIAADFLEGQWRPIPRTLLDDLAIELVRSRKMLHRCERPECQRYFVKEWSRDRYCSYRCSAEMRARGQSKWAQEHAQEIGRKRRKKKIAKREKQ
jgi:hypothetical protein